MKSNYNLSLILNSKLNFSIQIIWSDWNDFFEFSNNLLELAVVESQINSSHFKMSIIRPCGLYLIEKFKFLLSEKIHSIIFFSSFVRTPRS